MIAADVTLVTDRPSRRHATLRAGAALLLLILFVVMWVFAARFPNNAPVEALFFFMMSTSIIGGVIALIPLAIFAGTRSSRPIRPGGIGWRAISALPLTALPLLLWLLLGLLPSLITLSEGFRLAYLTETGILALFSGPVVLGIVFAVVTLRRGGTRTTLFAVVSLVFGAVLLAAMTVPTVLYGLGLTN